MPWIKKIFFFLYPFFIFFSAEIASWGVLKIS